MKDKAVILGLVLIGIILSLTLFGPEIGFVLVSIMVLFLTTTVLSLKERLDNITDKHFTVKSEYRYREAALRAKRKVPPTPHTGDI